MAPDIKIEAIWPGNSKQAFIADQQSALKIEADLMNHDLGNKLTLPYAVKGDAAALKIWLLQFITHEIAQSSNFPCDNNTITVSWSLPVPPLRAFSLRIYLFASLTLGFPDTLCLYSLSRKSNIPLLNTALCKPKLTIIGMYNTVKATGSLKITDVVAGTVSIFERSNLWCNGTVIESRWNNAHGTAAAASAIKLLTLDLMHSTTANSVYALSFVVHNPANAQTCPSTTLTGLFLSLSLALFHFRARAHLFVCVSHSRLS